MSTPTTPGATPEQFADLAREVAELTEEYEQARVDSHDARARETDVLNRLNVAQKALDKALDPFRKNAPQGSAWGQELNLRRGEPRKVVLP